MIEPGTAGRVRHRCAGAAPPPAGVTRTHAGAGATDDLLVYTLPDGQGAEHARRNTTSPICGIDRRGKYLAADCGGPVRGNRQVRRSQCPAHLRGFLASSAEVVDGDIAEIRHRSVPAV